MASFRDVTPDQNTVPGVEDDDMRGGESKKKKFKPLSAVRKLFGGKKRKKEDSVVAVKAHSTTALHRDDDDEDDDDGGFKAHQQKPLGLAAGTRSLSEDSVFSPDPRETPIGSFPKSAVSEESLPKSAFQSELFSKLNKRRSQYSDDDRDDGLPKSPVPPVTTADVIMGAPLKPPGKKSSNRDSDQSLISVDSSENEEDKLFESNWKSAVPSVRSSSKDQKGTGGVSMDPLDFSSIQKTELLTSGAAKDRISIKPKARRASRQSRKKRDTNSPQSLPSLNEESPPSPAETASPDWHSGVKYTKTNTPSGNTTPTGAATAKSPGVAGDVFFSSTPVSPSQQTPPSPTGKSISPTKAFTPASPGGPKTSGLSGSRRWGAAVQQSAEKSNQPTARDSDKNIDTHNGNNASRLVARFGDRPTSTVVANNSNSSNSTTAPSASSPPATETSGNVSLKARMSQFQASKPQNDDKPSFRQTGAAGLKSSDPGAKYSPKGDDFRLKRQNRSKTLPGARDDQNSERGSAQNSPSLQRAQSHRLPGTSKDLSPDSTPHSPEKRSSLANTTTAPQSSTLSSTLTTGISSASTSSSSTSVNKLGSRFSAFENTSSTSEPSWKNMVRKKKEETEGGASDGSTSPVHRGGNTPKSVFSSASYLEKKRGSVDSSSSSAGGGSKTSTPRDPNLDSVKEAGSSSSSSSPRTAPGKRESIEIDLSELSSVKSLAGKAGSSLSSSAFSALPPPTTSSSSSSAAAPLTSSMSERARLFSGAASSISKSGSSKDSETPSSGGASSERSGISQPRGGSVKTPSVVSGETTRPWLASRGGSVKVSPAFLASNSTSSSSSPASTSAAVSKPVLAQSSSAAAITRSDDKQKSTTTSSLSSKVGTSSHSSPSPAFHNKNSNNNTSLPSPQSALVTSSSSTSALATTPTPSSSSPTRTASVKTSNEPSLLTSKPPLATSAFGVKSSSVKSVSFSSSVKDIPSSCSPSVPQSTSSSSTTSSTTSSSPRSNSNASVISVSSQLSSSQSNLSKPSSTPGRINPVRAHASFTHPSSVKPVISPSSSPTINKSPSMRVTPLSSSSSSPSPNVATTTPVGKRPGRDDPSKTEEKTASVPAWRANLAAKKEAEMKIEIIESASKPPSSSSSSSTTPSQQQNKAEVTLRKAGHRSSFSETAKKTDPSPDKISINNRSSRVLDMVKSFQNLQVSS